MKTSKCGKCNKELPVDQFYMRPDRVNKPQSYCKSCLHRIQMDRWIERKLKAIQYLGGVCKDCNGVFPREVYDFHHRDPEEKDVSWQKLRLRSWDKITKELDKCDLLCANCHRIRHIVE